MKNKIPDDQNKHYWEVLQSMADAKFALKYLFNLASERVKENLNYAAALAELKVYHFYSYCILKFILMIKKYI